MPKNDQILRKLMLAQENPDLNIGFETKDLASLVITVMKAVRDIEGAIKNGRLDGKTPVAGKDYPTKAEISKALAEYVSKTDKDVSGKLTDLESMLKAKIETLTNGNDGVDGKDAEVTTEHIRQAAEIASGMIELPDIDLLVDTAIKSSGESIVDAINLLPDEDGVEMEKVKGLMSALNEITQRVSQMPRGQGGTIGTNVINKVINERIADGSIGGTIDTLAEIGDVSDTAATANQVLTWNSSSEEWEPADAPGASGGEANTVSNLGTGEGTYSTKVGVDLRFKSLVGGTGVTLSSDANEITIDRDAITASDVSDFDTEVANNSAVAANTAKVSNATHTGDVTGATALTIANGAVTAAKTSAGVQTSLGLADSATQPGDNISTLVNDAGYITAETDDQTAAEVPFTPAGDIVATDVQAAIEELDGEKLGVDALSANLILYPTTTASDIGGYVKLASNIADPDYDATAANVSTGAITTTSQLISSLASEAGLIEGELGVLNNTVIGNIRRTAGSGTATFYFEVYKRSSGGTETLLETSANTLPVSSGTYVQFSAAGLINNGPFLLTDRIVLKFYGNRVAGGSDPTYDFQFGGNIPTRALFPLPLTAVPTDAHNELSGLQGGTTNEYYHLTAAEKTVVENTSGTNTGDQTSIVGITGTKAQYDTSVTDGNFMYVGDAPTAHTHLLAAGATDVTATAAEVNILDGVTATTAEINFVDGVTSSIQDQLDGKADISTSINAQTGTTYTLVLGDVSKNVTMSNASANTLTVPPNSSVAFPVGTKVLVTQSGAGATTIAAGAGVTINAPSTVTLAIGEQHESRGLIKAATDTWTLM